MSYSEYSSYTDEVPVYSEGQYEEEDNFSDSAQTRDSYSETSLLLQNGEDDTNTEESRDSVCGRCIRCCCAPCRYFVSIVTSSPQEHTVIKSMLTFPIGVLCAYALYALVISPIKLPETTRHVIGGILGLALSIGFALSTYVRCTVALVVPTFFGKSGRSHITAFAMMYLLSGPVSNIIQNAGEMTNSLTCVTELLANHTAEKWKFRLKPVKDAMVEIQREGFMIKKISKAVNKAFQPIRDEIEGPGATERLKRKLRERSYNAGKREDKAAEIEKRRNLGKNQPAEKVVVNKWERKLDYKCEDIFSKGVENCRDWFRNLEADCMDKLWLLGYLLCLPLKLTVICEVVRAIPGVIGLDCNSQAIVNPGLGNTYVASRDMMENMDGGWDVNIQYKIVADPEALDYTGAEEARKKTMHEFESRRVWMDTIMVLLQRVLAFMFLLVFFSAYSYQKNYLSDFRHDNVYITSYFRHVDFRRWKKGKETLLPLKKVEAQKVIYPTAPSLMVSERRKWIKGTVRLMFRCLITAIVIAMDFLLFWVLDVIRRHSRIDYTQEGEQHVEVKVVGKGFISEIVRMFLVSFNSKHKIKNLSTNADCLPRPVRLEPEVIFIIYGIYFGLWVLMYFEAYGLRLRRLICKFFYRKREKGRVLFLYNEMLKKRRGFLRQMRHKVRKQVKARMLSRPLSVLQSIVKEFPECCKCLARFGALKDTCLICEDPRTNAFHDCETQDCPFTYCWDCWLDVRKKCYACQQKWTDGSDVSSSSYEDSDVTDDGLF